MQFSDKLRRIGHSLLPRCCQASSRPATRLANTIHTTNWLPKISQLIATSPSVYVFFLCLVFPSFFSSFLQMWKFSKIQNQNSTNSAQHFSLRAAQHSDCPKRRLLLAQEGWKCNSSRETKQNAPCVISAIRETPFRGLSEVRTRYGEARSP
jgi:hypothetical protein